MELCNLTEDVAFIGTFSTINAFNLLSLNSSIIIVTIIFIIKTQTLYTISPTMIINRNFGAQSLNNFGKVFAWFLPIGVIFRNKNSCDKNIYNSSSLVYFVSDEARKYNIYLWLQLQWLLLWWLLLRCVMTQWCLSSDWDLAQTGPWSPTAPCTSHHNNNNYNEY